MAENPVLARCCDAAGRALRRARRRACSELAGDKTRAREVAQRAGVPVLDGHRAGRATRRRRATAAAALGYPAVREGGDGRRRTRDAAGATRRTELERARWTARCARRRRRSATAPSTSSRRWCGRATSRCRSSPTRPAAIVHLFERDCSVQRRHQKVIEVTPGAEPRPRAARADLRGGGRRRPRDRLRQRGHRRVPASTATGEFAFIEMNPRIQVEHTVTEETTEVDLVRAQILIAGGATLADLGLAQDAIRQRGVALQCRVTTENPGNGFRPGRRADHRLPLARRRRDPPRRGLGVRRRRGLAVLRPAAGEGDRARSDAARAPPRARGARSPSCGCAACSTNQSFLARAAAPPDVPRRRDAHPLRRRASRSDRGRPGRRPRLAAARAAGRRDGQPRARAAGRRWSTRARSCRRSRGEPPTGLAPAAARARPGGVRRRAARADRRSR